MALLASQRILDDRPLDVFQLPSPLQAKPRSSVNDHCSRIHAEAQCPNGDIACRFM
jgi:hypothetical protein